jgi:hypothetical protein
MSTKLLLQLTLRRPLVFALFLVLAAQIVLGVVAHVAFTFTETKFIDFSQATFIQPQQINFDFEACRNDGGITLPDINGHFICPDGVYTSGNLGKFMERARFCTAPIDHNSRHTDWRDHDVQPLCRGGPSGQR